MDESDIMIMKLESGETIIGKQEVDCDRLGRIAVSQPCIVDIGVTSQTDKTPLIYFLPYAVFAENHIISLDQLKIVWTAKPTEEVCDQYKSIFSSIIVPSRPGPVLVTS